MPAPLVIPQPLNRVRAAANFADNPNLNITAQFLGRQAISLGFQGAASTPLPVLASIVQSPEPYMMATLTAHLVKSLQLAALFKRQMETNALIGDCSVFPDTAGLPIYNLLNCSIMDVREMPYSGTDPDFTVTISGYYLTNASMWD